MGGEQAGNVLTQVKQDGLEPGSWDEKEQMKFRNSILEQYETQGQPYYSSARLWDDGIIDPVDTRMILGLAISASLNAPVNESKFGVFRM